MVTRILLMLLCLGILSTVNGCYDGPAPYRVPSYGEYDRWPYQGELSRDMWPYEGESYRTWGGFERGRREEREEREERGPEREHEHESRSGGRR